MRRRKPGWGKGKPREPLESCLKNAFKRQIWILHVNAYPDANIYITYLMGQRGEELAGKFFKQGIGCRFSIVASNTMFAEVAQRCGESAKILLQKNIDDLRNAGKLEIIEKTPEETRESVDMAVKVDGNFGRNDMLHTILAKKYADIFVTNDRKLAEFASKTQKAMSLEAFVESEP